MDLIKLTNEFVQKINPDTRIEMRRCTPEDIRNINLREEQVGSLGAGIEFMSSVLCTPGIETNAVFVAGILVFVGGAVPKWGKVSDVWLLVDREFSILIQPYKKEFFMGFRYYLDKMNYERMQTGVLKGFDKGVQFAEALGFENEGLMRKQGPDGSDYWRYARIQKEDK